MAKGGKIKNWSRKSRTSHYYEWRHDNGKEKVVVKDHVAGTPQSRKGIHKTGKYQIYYVTKRGMKKNLSGPGIGSKERARKRAVKWMRKHPNP